MDFSLFSGLLSPRFCKDVASMNFFPSEKGIDFYGRQLCSNSQ